MRMRARWSLTGRPMRKAMTSELSVIAAQLIEAACRVRDGDREGAREYIAHAVALLHGKPSFEPSVTRALSKVCDAAADGVIDDGYDILIKGLRTGAVRGLRMIFVDGGPQIFPPLENLYHAIPPSDLQLADLRLYISTIFKSRPQRNTEEPASTAYRSLSRREAGVLQMIARGMSNKCIARSLGITPETVKTHVSSILSKLEARTRAQAVARAEAIGLL
jgi:DNA-binding CsgD family transcriptional regulator